MRRWSALLVAALFLPGCAHKAAIAEAESAVMEDPTSVEVWVMLGDTYNKAGREEDALAAYQRALGLSPGNAEIQARLSGLGVAQLSDLERDALANPTDDELWGDVGDEYALRGQNDRALEFYLYALQLDPTDGEWQRKVVEMGGIDQVAQLYESQLEGADDETLGDFADMLRSAGDNERACELYARANELDPGDSEWHEKLGMCPDHEPVGGYGGEVYPFDTGMIGGVLGGEIAYGSMSDQSHVARGRAALAAGDREGALEAFQTALLMDPTDRDALTAVMGLTGKTLPEVLGKLVERISDNDELWGDLGDARLGAGDRDGAIEAYREAARLDPSDSEWSGKLMLLDSDPAAEPLEEPLFELE